MRCKEVIIAINSCSTKMPHIITVRSECQVYFLASIMFQSQHNSCSIFLLDWRTFISRFLVFTQGQNILLHFNNRGLLFLTCIHALDSFLVWFFKYSIQLLHFLVQDYLQPVAANSTFLLPQPRNIVLGCSDPLFILRHRPLFIVFKVF